MPLVVDASAISAVAFAEPNGDTIAAHPRDVELVTLDNELARVSQTLRERHV